MSHSPARPLIAIACGGTGGHLFPGLAVAEELQARGCAIALLISPKEVDQAAVRHVTGMEVITLPAVALQHGGQLAFALGFWHSLRAARKYFRAHPPRAVLAMGGFTGAPPVLAGRWQGAKTFFHESNAIPGRANRWLAHVVDEGFVGFASATDHLFMQRVTTTGTPVRPSFQPMEAAVARLALRLDARRPVLLVMGGSQGASGINDLVLSALAPISQSRPDLQFLHLTGTGDADKVRQAYKALELKAIVHPFLSEMELALGAATVALSRAGASSLAELAAMRVPAVLIPYPAAADNHQHFNARALFLTGAARMVEQRLATPAGLAKTIVGLLDNPDDLAALGTALAAWHRPAAAAHIADRITRAIGQSRDASEPSQENKLTTLSPI